MSPRLDLPPTVTLAYDVISVNIASQGEDMSENGSDNPDNEVDEEEMHALLAELKNEHRRIDNEIEALEQTGVVDVLKIRRMKKIKLSIKDQIVFIENQLTPDIIA